MWQLHWMVTELLWIYMLVIHENFSILLQVQGNDFNLFSGPTAPPQTKWMKCILNMWFVVSILATFKRSSKRHCGHWNTKAMSHLPLFKIKTMRRLIFVIGCSFCDACEENQSSTIFGCLRHLLFKNWMDWEISNYVQAAKIRVKLQFLNFLSFCCNSPL